MLSIKSLSEYMACHWVSVPFLSSLELQSTVGFLVFGTVLQIWEAVNNPSVSL